jgi:hypothetical protein
MLDSIGVEDYDRRIAFDVEISFNFEGLTEGVLMQAFSAIKGKLGDIVKVDHTPGNSTVKSKATTAASEEDFSILVDDNPTDIADDH